MLGRHQPPSEGDIFLDGQPLESWNSKAFARYLSLLGGTCLSFYDWYCDLPPASPMTWGEQTDVPESAALSEKGSWL
jgi:nitrate reductase alpha subunit